MERSLAWTLLVTSALSILTACGNSEISPPAAETKLDPPTLAPMGMLAPGGIERVSIGTDGTQGNQWSASPSVSGDGRYVAFLSSATTLVPGDTNGTSDVFVHDRDTGQTILASVASDGTLGNASSHGASISTNGRYVAFSSGSTNLVPGDTNGAEDVFVRDIVNGTTERVSVGEDGAAGNSGSFIPSISADGRFVAFVSGASNLVESDTNANQDVFVHDRLTGQTTLVSFGNDGANGDSYSTFPNVSADGRYVAFTSLATNLVDGDTNGSQHVFVHDRATDHTVLISVASDGTQGDNRSSDPRISADGRYVAFISLATNLVLDDTNQQFDVFVHDRQTGQTERVSISSDGIQGNWASLEPRISADGRYVAFSSGATNLVLGDANNRRDVFVHDRATSQTERVSVASGGIEGTDHSTGPAMSADGHFVSFDSRASNLVPGDTNGLQDVFVYRQVVSDVTAPIISPAVDGILGLEGWYSGDVTVAWTVTDEESSIISTAGCEEVALTSDTAGVTYTCEATSAGGTASTSVTVKRDATAPDAEIVLAGETGENGWYVSPVEVSFQGDGQNDTSGLAGCSASLTLSVDGANQLVSGNCADAAGNITTVTASIDIDQTPPAVSATPDIASNSNGWWRDDVTVTFTGNDDTSGIASCDDPVNVNSDGAEQDVVGYCSDAAGNTAGATLEINLDKTAPNASAELSEPANANGWHNADVTVTFVGADDLSGVDACTAAVQLSAEGPGQAASGTCIDLAGNQSDPASATGINIDKTDPTASADLSAVPNANGWYNSGVTVTFTGSDGLSGVESCSIPVTLDSDGQDQGAAGTCIDLAGNESAQAIAVGIDIDTTAPTATANPSSLPNANGWHDTSVVVTFTGTDALSGVLSCAGPIELATEGAGQQAVGTCTDQAGNESAPAVVSDVNIDLTPPTLTTEAVGTQGDNGWYTSEVVVTFAGTDALSGIVTCDAPVSLATDGAGQSATGACVDAAGNTASTARENISIDRTPPVVAAEFASAPNPDGWHNSDLTVYFVGTDDTSGVATCDPPTVLTAEGRDIEATGRCIDQAGNIASATAAANIDKTPPTATATVTPAPNTNGWNNTSVTVEFSGTDDLSGIDTCASPATIDTEGSGHEASGTCVDRAGNESPTATARGISIDTTPPSVVMSGVTDGHVYPAGSPPTPTCLTADDLSGVAAPAELTVSGPASGVGSFTATCSGALDAAGNPGAEAVVAYEINYAFAGFFEPVQMGALNQVNANRNIPLKFTIAGGFGLDAVAGVPTVRRIACQTGEPVSDIDDGETTTNGQSGFQYDAATNEYRYNWSTLRSYAGSCRQLTLTLEDGTSYFANFQFR